MPKKNYTYVEVRLDRWPYMPTVHRGSIDGISDAAVATIIDQLKRDYNPETHTVCTVQCDTELTLIP